MQGIFSGLSSKKRNAPTCLRSARSFGEGVSWFGERVRLLSADPKVEALVVEEVVEVVEAAENERGLQPGGGLVGFEGVGYFEGQLLGSVSFLNLLAQVVAWDEEAGFVEGSHAGLWSIESASLEGFLE
jgi:hypothetical protein